MTGGGPLEGASPLLAVALTVRFLLELALLAAAAVLAWSFASGWWRWPASIVAVVGVAVVWGLFLSPKAAVPAPGAAKLAIEAILFLGIGAGLVVGFGYVTPAAIGVGVWIIDRIALALLQP